MSKYCPHNRIAAVLGLNMNVNFDHLQLYGMDHMAATATGPAQYSSNIGIPIHPNATGNGTNANDNFSEMAVIPYSYMMSSNAYGSLDSSQDQNYFPYYQFQHAHPYMHQPMDSFYSGIPHNQHLNQYQHQPQHKFVSCYSCGGSLGNCVS